MAVSSVSLPVGSPLPAFRLPDPQGVEFSSDDLMGEKGLLLIFTCNHCPYAKAVWPRTIRLAAEFLPAGIRTAAINPNIHPGYPEDAPEKMKEKIREWNIPFPYLIDATQRTARAFEAQCTPDIYLYGANGGLFYHGRVDDNWQKEEAVKHHELRDALQSLVAGVKPPEKQLPSLGCSIKWLS